MVHRLFDDCRPEEASTMKAVYIMQHGGPEVLQYGDLPDPAPRPDEVVVDTVAASVNGADWKVRAGESHRQSRFPYVLGRDFSGVVGAIGAAVDDMRVGAAVFGVLPLGRDGACAEKVAIKSALVTRKPERMSHVEAAAMALTGLTAISAIEETHACGGPCAPARRQSSLQFLSSDSVPDQWHGLRFAVPRLQSSNDETSSKSGASRGGPSCCHDANSSARRWSLARRWPQAHNRRDRSPGASA
jgi:Alcohol dehydrogenase GroES-like domain